MCFEEGLKVQEGLGRLLQVLGRDKGFFGRDRAFWFCVMTRVFVSRHGSQMTSYGNVAIWLSLL